MKRTTLVLASMTLALVLAGGLALAQSASDVTTYYKTVDKWGSYGSANGQFRSPVNVATDSLRHVYVVDTPNDRIQKFTSNGTFVTKWGTNGTANGEFRGP